MREYKICIWCLHRYYKPVCGKDICTALDAPLTDFVTGNKCCAEINLSGECSYFTKKVDR